MSASDKKRLRKEQAATQLTERQLREQAEAKKMKRLTTAFVAIMLVIALVAVSIFGTKAVNNSGIIDKNTIAAVIGSRELNSVQMNYYLNDAINEYYNQYYSTYGESASMYLAMSGLSTSLPLDEQVINQTTGETWADSFLEQALTKAKSDYALYDKAMSEGFQLTEEDQSTLNLNSQQIELYAMYYGYRNADQYLRKVYGYGSTLESYEEYCRVAYIANEYYNQHKDSLSYDNDAIRAEDNKDLNKYSSFSYNYYYLSTTSFLTGGTKDESGKITYSQEEKDASVAKAKEVANSLLTATDVTELDKAIAALEINASNTSAASTKKELVAYSSIPELMQTWIADNTREKGNITVIASEATSLDADGKEVKTISGYYVVQFEDRDENTRLLANVRHLLVQFEGGTTGLDGNKTYSDAEKAKAKEEAEKLLQQWKDGAATEDSFVALIKEHTDDTASKETGGLYEDIHRESAYVENFKNWVIDAERKAGDTGVVETEYGYHIMYYVGDGDVTYRDFMISEDLRATEVEAWHEDVVKDIIAKLENVKRLNTSVVLGSK